MGRKPCSNPYSTVGLDKFGSLSAELTAKRECVARKTGIPEAMVRFAHTSKGWVPLVLKKGSDGGKEGGLLSIETQQDTKNGLASIETQQDIKNGLASIVTQGGTKKVEGEPYEEHAGISDLKGHENGVNGYSATAMVVIMVALAGSLKRLWLCGVMCMKSFIDSGIFYFSEILKVGEHIIKPMFCDQFEAHESSGEQGGLMLYSSMRQGLNTQEKEMKKSNSNNNNNEKFGRSVSKEGQARKSIQGLQQSGSFSWRAANGESDVTVGATLMIILLFFLLVYGRLCAICLTSALLYVVPKLRTDGGQDIPSNDYYNMVLQSKEYRKKVIMDGLLARNHGKL